MTDSKKIDESNNSGFLFGMALGAAIGALSAVLIHKNSEAEVVQNFESKVKDFFQDLINDPKTKPKKKDPTEEIEFIDADQIITEPVTKRKPTPKMFVKPKR